MLAFYVTNDKKEEILVNIKCPRCQSYNLESASAITTGGWIAIILGLFLAIWIIGIPMIIIGMCSRHKVYICRDCGKKF